MGKQIAFYLLPEDELQFIQFIFDNNNVLVKVSSDSPDPPIIDTLDGFLNTQNEIRFLIWNRTFKISPDMIKRHQERLYDEVKGIYFETNSFYYTLNFIDGPFIDYKRSLLEENLLSWGRIWINMYQSRNGKLTHKGKEFEKWYAQFTRWFRNNCRKVKEVDAFFGLEALKWFSQGGTLALYGGGFAAGQRK